MDIVNTFEPYLLAEVVRDADNGRVLGPLQENIEEGNEEAADVEEMNLAATGRQEKQRLEIQDEEEREKQEKKEKQEIERVSAISNTVSSFFTAAIVSRTMTEVEKRRKIQAKKDRKKTTSCSMQTEYESSSKSVQTPIQLFESAETNTIITEFDVKGVQTDEIKSVTEKQLLSRTIALEEKNAVLLDILNQFKEEVKCKKIKFDPRDSCFIFFISFFFRFFRFFPLLWL